MLKIRKDHLEALEEDRLEALPGRTYAVGFVRSYADYLGLDAVHCVERFKAEIAGRSDADHIPQVHVIDEDEHRRLPQGWKIVAAKDLPGVSVVTVTIPADAPPGLDAALSLRQGGLDSNQVPVAIQ